MEERGTMGEIKSLVLVISGDDVKSSPKKVVIRVSVKKEKVKMFQHVGERGG